jgi:uncharacterized protein
MRVSWPPAAELHPFYVRYTPWLERDALIHNQLLGALHGAVAGRYDAPCWTLAVLDDADQPALVAVRAPRRALHVSLGELDAIDALARALHARQAELPAVMGPADQARAFAAAWCALHADLIARVERQLVLYRCEAVTPPLGVPGQPRRSTIEDTALITRWAQAFERDTNLPLSSDVEPRMRQLCGASDVLIWEVDGVPVACAAVVRRAAQTASIGLVYTPPEQRRQGFAAAVTAALTAQLLHGGLTSTNLFTDAANATTNHIYPAIGYTRVIDYLDMAFVPRASQG